MARRGTSHLSGWAKPVERGKKWREKRGRNEEREAPLSLYFSRRFDCRRSSEQKAKFILAARASSRDRNRGVSTKSKR